MCNMWCATCGCTSVDLDTVAGTQEGALCMTIPTPIFNQYSITVSLLSNCLNLERIRQWTKTVAQYLAVPIRVTRWTQSNPVYDTQCI